MRPRGRAVSPAVLILLATPAWSGQGSAFSLPEQALEVLPLRLDPSIDVDRVLEAPDGLGWVLAGAKLAGVRGAVGWIGMVATDGSLIAEQISELANFEGASGGIAGDAAWFLKARVSDVEWVTEVGVWALACVWTQQNSDPVFARWSSPGLAGQNFEEQFLMGRGADGAMLQIAPDGGWMELAHNGSSVRAVRSDSESSRERVLSSPSCGRSHRADPVEAVPHDNSGLDLLVKCQGPSNRNGLPTFKLWRLSGLIPESLLAVSGDAASIVTTGPSSSALLVDDVVGLDDSWSLVWLASDEESARSYRLGGPTRAGGVAWGFLDRSTRERDQLWVVTRTAVAGQIARFEIGDDAATLAATHPLEPRWWMEESVETKDGIAILLRDIRLGLAGERFAIASLRIRSSDMTAEH